jgi:hypothetical protein
MAPAPRAGALFAAYIALFSRRTPLNFFAAFFFAAGFLTATERFGGGSFESRFCGVE